MAGTRDLGELRLDRTRIRVQGRSHCGRRELGPYDAGGFEVALRRGIEPLDLLLEHSLHALGNAD